MIWYDLCRQTGSHLSNPSSMITSMYAVNQRKLWQGYNPVKVVQALISYAPDRNDTSAYLQVELEPIDGKYHNGNPSSSHPKAIDFKAWAEEQRVVFTEVTPEEFKHAVEKAKEK